MVFWVSDVEFLNTSTACRKSKGEFVNFLPVFCAFLRFWFWWFVFFVEVFKQVFIPVHISKKIICLCLVSVTILWSVPNSVVFNLWFPICALFASIRYYSVIEQHYDWSAFQTSYQFFFRCVFTCVAWRMNRFLRYFM